MKSLLSKNYKFIQLSEKPVHAELGGFKIYHRKETEREYPIVYTDLVAGKLRYYLNKLPKEIRTSIWKLEIRQGDSWFNTPLIDNNL